jgi:membrane-anchored mycosin MYCP
MSVAAATIPVLCSALPGAAATMAGAPSADDPGPVSLPVISSALAPGRPCTGTSPTQAHAQPWTVRALGLSRTRQLTQGAGITVAVVDTGVGTDAPALTGRVTATDGAGQDCVGHGSFAAGLIAATVDQTGGGGVAPQARILAVRVTDPRGATTPGKVANGIRAAVDHGAGVVYVGAALATGRDELTAAVAYATRKNVLVVAPAAPDVAPAAAGTPPVSGIAPSVAPTAGGNATGTTGGTTLDQTARPYFPAFIPQVVSVADYGADGSRPKEAPDIFAADLAAPGDAVVSIGPKGTGDFIGSGSSLAAATVAGTAALVLAYHPHLTPAQIQRAIVVSGYPAAIPILDPYAAVASVPSTEAGSAPKPAVPVRMTGPAPSSPRTRALIAAAAGGGIVALVAGAAVVIPLGRARRWRPAGRDQG